MGYHLPFPLLNTSSLYLLSAKNAFLKIAHISHLKKMRLFNKRNGSFRNCHHMSLQHNNHHAPSQLIFDDHIVVYSHSIMMHHPTSSPSSNIMAITQYSCHNMMHQPASSPSYYIMAIVSIHAATCCIILHHHHHPALWQS